MHQKELNVCYVIYSEEIWIPLLKRQVTELLQTVISAEPKLKLRLLYIFPWYWQFLKRKELKALKNEFTSSTIALKLLPVPFPFPFPYFFPKYIKGMGLRPFPPDAPHLFWVLKLLILPIFLKYVYLDNFKIFHCRSYPAAAILLPAKKFFKKIKLVFDPRSDFPEENILQSGWKKNSQSFKYWKAQEKELLLHSSVTICISKIYRQHYQRYCNEFKHQIIPNNVDSLNIKFDSNARESIRRKYSIDNKIVFCYLGNMSPGGWHCPYVYAKVIKEFRAINKQHLFLFLVPDNANTAIKSAFKENAIHSSEFMIVNPDYYEVSKYLSAADYGILYLNKEKIALGTKVVEYTAAGLPVLVNSNIKSAASYVQEYGTGIVLDLSIGGLDIKKAIFNNIHFETADNIEKREKTAQVAASLYSNEVVAKKYIQQYKFLAES